MSVKTVLGQILEQAARRPGARAMTLVHASGAETAYSFAELVSGAGRRAAALRHRGIREGDLVLLLTDELAELVPLFLGTMMTGALPAILPVPVTGRGPASLAPLRERISRTKARMLITSSSMHRQLSAEAGADCGEVVAVGEVAGEAADPVNRCCQPDPAGTAYIQFSSGTTGVPKGLMVSHTALFNQVHHYARAIALSGKDVSISWSPLYHDQGLVSNMLMPLSHGVHTVLMTPATWLKNPALFFQAVDRHQCTVSRWPNFAFLYTASRVPDSQMAGVSLRSLRLIASSGEPITPDAWPVFQQRFASYGLRDGVMNGSYGMAENCLCISVGPLGEPLRQERLSLRALNREGIAEVVEENTPGSQVFVASGKVMSGTEVRIINRSGQRCPDRRVGEIAIRGDCLLNSYYPGSPFPARAYSNGFYRTGDLGYLADGWLTVTGRSKDVVNIGGVSIHPEQVERIASQIGNIRPGRVIALGVHDGRLGTEKLVVVCELADDDEQARQAVRRQLQEKVLEGLSVWLSRVEFRNRGWIEKTTSGKLSRFRNREKLLGLAGHA